MRRIFVLLILLGAVRLMEPLAPDGSATLLAFGFLLLAAYTSGELARSVRVPKLLGYLVAGVLFGPDVLGVVARETTYSLTPVSDVAIALIAFLAGAELQWKEVRARGTLVLRVLVSEIGLTTVVLSTLALLVLSYVPPFVGAPVMERLPFALLFGVVASVHSPAVTMGLLSETGANGPVARTTLGVVLLADVLVVLLFSGALGLARALVPPSGTELITSVSVGLVLWEIVGALLIGALLGGLVVVYLRIVERELVFFALLIAVLGAEVTSLAHVETLLALLTAGFVAENFSRGLGHRLREAAERAAAPIFVVFFALAGAKISIPGLASTWYFVVPLALARIASIWGGTRLGLRWAGQRGPELGGVWMGLISQAGVALGLASVVAKAYPQRGEALRALFLGLIAINETLGPLLFRRSLVSAGEVDPEAASPQAAGAH